MSETPVRLLLLDFVPYLYHDENTEQNQFFGGDSRIMLDDGIFSKFLKHMRGESIPCIPFSLKLHHVLTIGKMKERGKDVHSFANPSSIAISYYQSCILVGDYGNKRVSIFDLQTKQFKACFRVETSGFVMLCVEENFDGIYSDALYVVSGRANDSALCKYNLMKIVTNHGNAEYVDGTSARVWACTSPIDSQGIVYSNKKVYISDYTGNCVHILESISGQYLQRMDFSDGIPFSIIFVNDGKHAITAITNSGSTMDRVQIFETNNYFSSNEKDVWTLLKTIGKSGTNVGEFKFPSSVAYDPVSKYIFVADCYNHRVQIFTWEGQFVKSFGNDNQLYCARAICFCKVTGELIICDSDNHRVLVLR